MLRVARRTDASRVNFRRTTGSNPMTNPTTMPAVTHVAITVTDIEASKQWYTRVLGAEAVLDEDTGPFRHVVYALGNTLLGLHAFPVLSSEEKFDERRPGLDHIAFGVGSRQELVGDRKSTRLNSSHSSISYAVFCLK